MSSNREQSVVVSLRLKPEIAQFFKKEAARQGLRLNTLLESMLDRLFSKRNIWGTPMKYRKVIISTLLLGLSGGIALADRTALPEKYYEHGLIDDAKRGFISIIFDKKANDTEKAESLSFLGDIAFDEREVSLALSTWRELIETFPTSDQARLAVDRINQIGEVVDATTGDTLDNPIAQSYIRHGDWWSNRKKENLTIDTSSIPRDKVAIGWYDRVIDEFPETDAVVLALKKKFYTVYGWEDSDEMYGVLGSRRPVSDLIAVYEELSATSPNDPDFQRFRYMIAQSYLEKMNCEKSREWLQKIIDREDGMDGFYKDLAEWRMKSFDRSLFMLSRGCPP